MHNVIQFPSRGRSAPDSRTAQAEGREQQVFSQEQAAQLTYDDGLLYGWAAQDGRLPAHYWQLEADLRELVVHHGVVMAAVRLDLPVPFVRGWAVELGVDNPQRLRALQQTEPAPDLSAEAAAAFAVSPLADDAFFWVGTSVCA
jgi:hypothetical protein